jgi:hypothetical protein
MKKNARDAREVKPESIVAGDDVPTQALQTDLATRWSGIGWPVAKRQSSGFSPLLPCVVFAVIHADIAASSGRKVDGNARPRRVSTLQVSGAHF